MEFQEVIRNRKSVRAYGPEPVPDEVISRILEAARVSPSAKNLQPWHYIVVRDPDKRKVLAEGMWAKFLKEAPVVIVGCGNRKESPHWSTVDTTIGLQTLVLAATAEGLGTCWVGSFKEESVKNLLNIPEEFHVVCLVAVGYERGKRDLARAVIGGAKRKGMKDIASLDDFGRPWQDI